MSETPEEEMARKEREWKEERKRKKGERREIEVSIDTSSMETLVGKIKDLEPKAEAFKSLAQNLARKCRNEGLDIDSSNIRTVEDFKDTVQRLYQKKSENEGIEVRVEKKGGEGQIPLNMQSGSSGKEYSTVDSMIDDLRRQASRENEEGENAKAILDEFWRKSLSGQKELKRGSGEMQYVGKKKPSGKEEGMNEERAREFRKRRKQREEDENE